MDSYEIDPFTSERTIDAASRGELADGSGALGELLTSLHDSPSAAECSGVLPADAVVVVPDRKVTGRVTRRTAVAASIALFALSGVAAAVTGGGGGVFEPILAGDAPEEIQPAGEASIDEPVVVDSSDGLSDKEFTTLCDEATSCGSSEVETDGGDATADEPIVVDPTDGLSDEELTVLCDEATNHGDYVAEVAQDQVTEGSHGERVATEADSECGAPEVDTDGGDDAVGGQPDPLPVPDPLPSADGVEVSDNVRTGNQGQNPND